MPMVSCTRASSPNAIAAAVPNPISTLNALFDMLQRDLSKKLWVLVSQKLLPTQKLHIAGDRAGPQQDHDRSHTARPSVSEVCS
jgi:hypothetical protein